MGDAVPGDSVYRAQCPYFTRSPPGESGVGSVITSKGPSMSPHQMFHPGFPGLADVPRCCWRNATISSGSLYPSLETWQIRYCFIKWFPKAFLEDKKPCPSCQRDGRLSLGRHLQWDTLVHSCLSSSVTPSGRKSARSFGGGVRGHIHGCSRGDLSGVGFLQP